MSKIIPVLLGIALATASTQAFAQRAKPRLQPAQTTHASASAQKTAGPSAAHPS